MMWGSLGCGWCMMMVAILLSFKVKPQYSEEVGTKTSEAAVAFFFLCRLLFLTVLAAADGFQT